MRSKDSVLNAGHIQKLFEEALVIAACPASDDGLDLDIFARQRFEAQSRQRWCIGIDVQRGAVDGGAQQQCIQFQVIFDVGFLLAFLHLVQRRLRNVDVPALDQNGHLPVEEREQQRAYVGSIDVRICHDNDAMISQLIHVEVIAPDAAPQRRYQSADFGGCQHFVEAGFFDVEDFALERQDGLSAPISALLRRAAGRIAFDQEHLGQRGILFLAVGQLAGQARDVQRTFAPGHFTRLARGLARVRGLEDFIDDGTRFLRVLQEEFLQACGDRRFDHSLHFRGDKLVLGLG
jgi:hypothetical protein